MLHQTHSFFLLPAESVFERGGVGGKVVILLPVVVVEPNFGFEFEVGSRFCFIEDAGIVVKGHGKLMADDCVACGEDGELSFELVVG